MSRPRITILALVIAIGTLLSIATSSTQAGPPVVIRPNSGEVSITQGQRVSAMLYRGGWISCSAGLDADYRTAAITRMELWRGAELVQVVDKKDGAWDIFPWEASDACVHVNAPVGSNWSFDRLKLHRVGDYELRWTRGWSVPLTDGGDYTGNGEPDVYQPTSEFWVVLIHVLPQGGGS
jgi:hypothetical protein